MNGQVMDQATFQMLKRLGLMGQDTVSEPTAPQMPGNQTVSSPSVSAPQQSESSSFSLDQELSKPMPTFDPKPQPQVGGIRGLLAMLASGIGHGAGAQSVGEGISRSFSGLQQDAEQRRQLDYQRQAQQYKNVYDAEAYKRANLVRLVQQRRAEAEANARRAHENRMAGIATDRAGFDMAKAGQRLIESEANRTSADTRSAADRTSREGIASRLQAGALERAKIHASASRANAAQRASNRGEITPTVAVKNVQDLENKLAIINAQIATHKNKKFTTGARKGQLLNPWDDKGGNPEINPLWNRQKALKKEISQWRNWMARFGQGVPPPGESVEQPPQQTTQEADPILSLFSDILQ